LKVASRGLNLFISADIEGCTGIASFSQCGRPDGAHYDYGFARRIMCQDLNAVIRGARRAGAGRIVVKDGHATCKNLLVDDLEDGVELISGLGPTPDGMMDGIDSTFDAAMLVGYHGRAGALRGMMDHALVGSLHEFWVNGKPAGEILVNSAVAGAYGVPVVLVTSDEVGCAEARQDVLGVETFSTKSGLAKFMGLMKGPSAEELEVAGGRAFESRDVISPVTVVGPVEMRASFRNCDEVDLACTADGVTRLDGYTLEWRRDTFLEAHRVALDVFQLAIVGRRSVQ
jgi:D-amino peptidase